MRVFSYFSPVKGLNFEDEYRLAMLWMRAWKEHGFEPVMLNEWQAKKHPYFEEFSLAVAKFPTTNPSEYEYGCYVRHLAMVQAGGGWLFDSDVLPHAPADEIKEILLCLESDKLQILQTPCCPCVSYATAETRLRACKAIVESGDIGKPHEGLVHKSDQYIFERLVMDKADWIEVHDIVKLWSDKGWEKALLLHFANAVCGPAGKTPRHEHIPNLLKS